jgi:hypothetical protein
MGEPEVAEAERDCPLGCPVVPGKFSQKQAKHVSGVFILKITIVH